MPTEATSSGSPKPSPAEIQKRENPEESLRELREAAAANQEFVKNQPEKVS